MCFLDCYCGLFWFGGVGVVWRYVDWGCDCVGCVVWGGNENLGDGVVWFVWFCVVEDVVVECWVFDVVVGWFWLDIVSCCLYVSFCWVLEFVCRLCVLLVRFVW